MLVQLTKGKQTLHSSWYTFTFLNDPLHPCLVDLVSDAKQKQRPAYQESGPKMRRGPSLGLLPRNLEGEKLGLKGFGEFTLANNKVRENK